MSKECPKCGGRGMYHDSIGYRFCECKKKERKKVVDDYRKSIRGKLVDKILKKSAEKKAKEWLKEKHKREVN